ncbi:MAG: hypothetical protein JWM88_593 [Verrucomicrobia bacterium]|nr:hypothetical protein [Verrucomicrobiota bacterium]
MKKSPRRSLDRLAVLLALAAAGKLSALAPTEWRQRQPFTVAAPGLTRIAVPAAVFDATQPGLADLRVIDAGGAEVACLLDTPPDPGAEPEENRWVRPRFFRAARTDSGTQLVLETGAAGKLDAVELETSAPFFLHAAHVDISGDGREWKSTGPAVAVFRQFGAEQLRLSLGARVAAFVRITIDDVRSRPVAFTGARLQRVSSRPPPPELVPVGARIVRREEFAGETVLTVELDGKQLPLGRLGLVVQDPIFMRRVTVSVRKLHGSALEERVAGAGPLYRVALDGVSDRAGLGLPLGIEPPTRELFVHIQNGDSPPLRIDGVEVSQFPVNLLFIAPAAGSYFLLAGNPQASTPRYDLAGFAGDLRSAAAVTVTPGPPEATPGYHPREFLSGAGLPDAPFGGAALDAKAWAVRRPVALGQPGVQELELDAAALAHSRPDFADLRLLRAGKQVPYLLEQPALARSLPLEITAEADPKRPTASVWRARLPQTGLPLRRLTLSSTTPLFQRQIRVYEKITGPNGGTVAMPLTEGPWSRTPEAGTPETRVFELTERVRTRTLWIETENGDNPAIALASVRVTHPVVRLIFQATATDGLELVYGNKAANAPHYDLSLVAAKLLTSTRHEAKLAESDAAEDGDGGNVFSNLDPRLVFWGALALVVVSLLLIVAKLLPKAT